MSNSATLSLTVDDLALILHSLTQNAMDTEDEQARADDLVQRLQAAISQAADLDDDDQDGDDGADGDGTGNADPASDGDDAGTPADA